MNSPQPPAGRVTLVFTDIEDSSRMTNALGDVYREKLLPEHHQRIRAVVVNHQGYVVKSIGDSFMLAFDQPTEAIACAAAIQEAVTTPALTATDSAGKAWTVKVRIGVHRSLEPLEPRSSPECPADYLGSDVNFAARIESLGAGGQALVSGSAHDAARFGAPEQWKEWPHRRIKSFDQPETVWEFLWDGQSRGEPGARFLPDWFKGEQNRYIPRPDLEQAVLAHFGKLRPDGSVPRIVTLHAYGGMGKTRLAVACAMQTVGLFKDGVFFVRLDDKPPTTAAVAEAMGAALGLAREAAVPAKVIAALRDKELLLLLDNYESVDSEEVQTFLIELLRGTSAVRLLVTGREAVKLSDVEQEISLDGGMAEAEAEELFLARARLKYHQAQAWQPDPAEQSAIRRIVRLSERIPVAIELAAAWVSHSTVKEIADGIESTPLGSETKEPPRSGRIDQALRHRSLTRSLNYSYERLEPEAQAGFARLGLFAGSFGFDTVAGACGLPQAKELLYRLQDASLIHRVEIDGRSRFTMLRPTRAYAAEKLEGLPEASTIRQQFVRNYRDAAKQQALRTGPSTETHARIAALDWFEEEWPNLLAAVRAALVIEDWKSAPEISGNSFRFLEARGFWSEAEDLYKWALVAHRKSQDRRGEAFTLDHLGGVYSLQSRWGEAEQVLQQSVAIHREFQDRVGEASSLNNLGTVYQGDGRWAEAERVFRQSLEIYGACEDRPGKATTLNNLGNVHQSRGHWAEAEQAYLQSLAMARELGDRTMEGQIFNNLGIVYNAQGRWAEAEKAVQQTLTIDREFKRRLGEANALVNLGVILRAQKRLVEAEQLFQQGLAIKRECQDRYGQWQALHNLGLVYYDLGLTTEAEHALQESAAILREFNDRHGLASPLKNLARVYSRQGRLKEAEQAFLESLKIYREFHDRRGETEPLQGLGRLLHAQGRLAEAGQALQQALANYRELKDRENEGYALNDLGLVYRAQGRLAEAEETSRQSLAIKREFRDRTGEGQLLFNLALIKASQGDGQGTLAFMREAVAVLETTDDESTLQRARDLLKQLEAGS
jgi:tetratricopeptide (TPR) repeat protein/class 3 adenylate cyclase